MSSKGTIQDAIDHWGVQMQTIVCMEECSELIKECSKMLRGKCGREHLIEEMADVYICLEMLKKMYGITSTDIVNERVRKLERLRKRIEEDK